MSDETLIKPLEESLRLANTILFKRGRSILAGMEVSSPQFNALLTLQQWGSLTMGELCKHLFTACSTATDLADRLEKAGYVVRARDSKDRRVVRIQLLPKGEAVVQAVIAERQRFLDEVLQGYAGPEHDNLLMAIQILSERMEKLDAELNAAKEN